MLGFRRPLADNEVASAKRLSISFTAPTPGPIEIFSVDSAGNVMMRGVEAVIPGLPSTDPKAAKISAPCRASATRNGDGTLTICVTPEVGKILAAKLGGESR